MARTFVNTTLLSFATVVASIQTGCSAKVRDYPPDNPGVGGGNATGGTLSTGGKSSTGGSIASSGASTDGVVSTGGSSSGIVTGGTFNTGGSSSTGGTTASSGPSTGGTVSTGGITGGSSQMVTGGASGSGGTSTATGGAGGSAPSCPFGATTALCGICAVWTFDTGAQGWTADNNGPAGGCAATAVLPWSWPNTNNTALRIDVTATASNCHIANVTFPVCSGGTDVTGRTLHATVRPVRTDGEAASTGRLWLRGTAPQSSKEISIPDNTTTQISVPITIGGVVTDLGISYAPSYPWEGYLWLDDVYFQ